VLSTTVEPEIKTLMTDIISMICEDEKNEENDNRHVLPERNFGSLVKQWEKTFEVGCECGESHRLYPEPKKVVAGDLASLMRILRTICGASHERQLILLEILQKFTIGKVSAEQFVEQCEKYFITNTEYSKVYSMPLTMTHPSFSFASEIPHCLLYQARAREQCGFLPSPSLVPGLCGSGDEIQSHPRSVEEIPEDHFPLWTILLLSVQTPHSGASSSSLCRVI
jgi:hypothetical protein